MIADYQQFFSDMDDFRIEGRFYENGQSFTIEELYQAFKARMIAELVVDVPGASHYGRLEDE